MGIAAAAMRRDMNSRGWQPTVAIGSLCGPGRDGPIIDAGSVGLHPRLFTFIRCADCGLSRLAFIATFLHFFRQIAYRGLGTARGLW